MPRRPPVEALPGPAAWSGKHLDLIQQVVPGAERIGVPYNPGEANAVTLVELLTAEAGARGCASWRHPLPGPPMC